MSQMSTRVQQAFDAWAERYEETMTKAEYFSPGWIARHAHDLDGLLQCRVLDIGCGTGLNLKALYERHNGIRADGVDVSLKMLDQARATNRYERLYNYDLNNGLPGIPSETFDLVIAFGCLEFLSDITVCLRECRRVLKVDGILWASFQRFEPSDEGSPPRKMSFGEIELTGYSTDEIRQAMNSLCMRVTTLDSVVGYVSITEFACPFYVMIAHKA